MILTRKTVVILAALALVIITSALVAVAFLANQPWYTSYPGVIASVEYDGKKYTVPYRTFFEMKVHLASMRNDPALAKFATPIAEKLETYMLLLDNFKDAQGMSVDFIALIHRPFNPDDDFDEAVVKSQAETLQILRKQKFDIVGSEGSWSDPLTKDSFFEENIQSWRRELNLRPFPPTFKEVVGMDWNSRSTFRYKDEDSAAYLIGYEDRELFWLHGEVNSLMRTGEGSLKDHLRYREYDKVLVWFRTEIALAKVLAVMKQKKLKRGVITMGQSHRYQFDMLRHQLRLNSTIHHTVPEKYRDDEAG